MQRPALFLLLLLGILLSAGCAWMPFVGGEETAEETEAVISIFDRETYLQVNEYDFPEYEWGRDAKIAEEMYIKGLVDYFYRDRWERAIVVFNSALKVYKKDARIYTRLAECHARLGRLPEAINVLNMGAGALRAYNTMPGVARYRSELETAYASRLNPPQATERGLLSSILHYPAKLWPF